MKLKIFNVFNFFRAGAAALALCLSFILPAKAETASGDTSGSFSEGTVAAGAGTHVAYFAKEVSLYFDSRPQALEFFCEDMPTWIKKIYFVAEPADGDFGSSFEFPLSKAVIKKGENVVIYGDGLQYHAGVHPQFYIAVEVDENDSDATRSWTLDVEAVGSSGGKRSVSFPISQRSKDQDAPSFDWSFSETVMEAQKTWNTSWDEDVIGYVEITGAVGKGDVAAAMKDDWILPLLKEDETGLKIGFRRVFPSLGAPREAEIIVSVGNSSRVLRVTEPEDENYDAASGTTRVKNLKFKSGGDRCWKYESSGNVIVGIVDDSSNLRTLPLSSFEESWIETEIVGPGNFSCYMFFPNESRIPFLSFTVDGSVVDTSKITEGEDIYLGDGKHVLRWTVTGRPGTGDYSWIHIENFWWNPDNLQPITVNFDANGGTLSETSIVYSAGNLYGTLPTPIRVGYKFLGWFTEKIGGTRIDSDSEVLADVTALYAHWEAVDETMKQDLMFHAFRLNESEGGDAETCFFNYSPIFLSFSIGDSVKRAVTGNFSMTLVLENYYEGRTTYSGNLYPFSSISAGKTFDVEDALLQQLQNLADGKYRLTCTIRRNGDSSDYDLGNNSQSIEFSVVSPMTVVFDANGGTTAVSSRDYKPKQTYDAYGSLPTPTRERFKFLGWFTEAEGGELRTDADTVVGSETLYAHWEALTIDVSFDTCGGGTIEPRTYWFGKTYESLPTPSARYCYDFVGWFTSPTGGRLVEATDAVSRYTGTLYAHWEKSTYDLKFTDALIGVSSDGVYKTSFSTTFSSLSYKIITFDFTVREADSKSISGISLQYNATVWKVDPTTGTKTNLYSKSHNLKVGTPNELPLSPFYSGIYELTVSLNSAHSQDESDASNNTYTVRFYVDEPITPEWVTFDPCGGSCPVTGFSAKATISKYSEALADFPVPTRSGYEFAGWFTKESGGVRVTPTAYHNPATSTLYAQWKEPEAPAELASKLELDGAFASKVFALGAGTWTTKTSVSWLKASVGPDGNLRIFCEENPAGTRSGTLFVSDGLTTKTIRVTQQSSASGTNEITMAFYRFKAEGGSVDIGMVGTTPSDLPTWLSASREGGAVTLTAEANAGTATRSALVVVNLADGGKRAIFVSQAGTSAPVRGEAARDNPELAGALDSGELFEQVWLDAGGDERSWTLPDDVVGEPFFLDQSWLDGFADGDTITVAATENPGELRETFIFFRTEDGGVYALFVKQNEE